MDKGITLTNFAPFIQLWAGICLLFFYEVILEKTPFDKNIKTIDNLLKSFLNYQLELNKKIEVINSYNLNWAKNVLPSIKNIAALSFFYSVLLLIFIGIGNYDQNWNYALYIVNWAVIIYMFICGIFYGFKWFHTYITPVIYFTVTTLLFIIIILFENDIINSLYYNGISVDKKCSDTYITVFSLFVCLSSLIVALIRILWEYLTISSTEKRVKIMYEKFVLYAKVRLGFIKLEDLPDSIKNIIVQKAGIKFLKNKQVSRDYLNDIITEEIQNEFDSFVNWSTPFYIKLWNWLRKNRRSIYICFSFILLFFIFFFLLRFSRLLV